MKVTKNQLRRIIQETVKRKLGEVDLDGSRPMPFMDAPQWQGGNQVTMGQLQTMIDEEFEVALVRRQLSDSVDREGINDLEEIEQMSEELDEELA